MIGGLNCVFCDSQGGQDHEHPSGPRLPVCHARQRRPRCDGRQQRGRVQRQLLHPAPGLGARASGSAHVLAEERRDRHCHAGYGTGEKCVDGNRFVPMDDVEQPGEPMGRDVPRPRGRPHGANSQLGQQEGSGTVRSCFPEKIVQKRSTDLGQQSRSAPTDTTLISVCSQKTIARLDLYGTPPNHSVSGRRRIAKSQTASARERAI